jgi:predicted phage-related endonuclease
MITTTNDRHNFIGGSEANMMYLNYETDTFKAWWAKKLTGVNEINFNNLSMSVGTILEHDVIDLYEAKHQVKGLRDETAVKGIARANTDYIQGDKVSDVKVTKKAFEWFLADKVPANYKRQLIHYCYVLDLRKASIIAYLTDDDTLNNPFEELDENKLFEIPVKITEKDIKNHKAKLDYLEFCKETNQFPK